MPLESTTSSCPTASPRLLIVSPVKDEAEFLERTIASIAAQTMCPRSG